MEKVSSKAEVQLKKIVKSETSIFLLEK